MFFDLMTVEPGISKLNINLNTLKNMKNIKGKVVKEIINLSLFLKEFIIIIYKLNHNKDIANEKNVICMLHLPFSTYNLSL